MSLKGFSQTVTDTTSIQLKKNVARLVIKDLIKGDSEKQKAKLFEKRIILLENKISLKDSIIFKLNTQLSNFNNIHIKRTQQLEISQQLSERLQQDLKKQRLQTKLFKYGGGAAVLGVAALILIK